MSDAAIWMRSIKIAPAKFWLGLASFQVGPKVIAKWLKPETEALLIACGQALGDVLHGVIKVRCCGVVCFEVGVSFVSQDVIVDIIFLMFKSRIKRLMFFPADPWGTVWWTGGGCVLCLVGFVL